MHFKVSEQRAKQREKTERIRNKQVTGQFHRSSEIDGLLCRVFVVNANRHVHRTMVTGGGVGEGSVGAGKGGRGVGYGYRDGVIICTGKIDHFPVVISCVSIGKGIKVT